MYLSSTQVICDEIGSRLNEAVDNDQFTKWVNLCTYDVQLDFPNAPFLRASADRTLSSGTRQYAVETDYEKMNSISYPGGDVKLTYLPPQQFDMLQPSASESGTPSIYTIRGNDSSAIIEYYPSPGSSIIVHEEYDKLMVSVASGATTPPLPKKYWELYVHYGHKMGLLRRGEYGNAQTVDQQYQVMKEKMRQDLLYRTTEPLRIRGTRDFTGGRNTSDPIGNAFFG